MNKICEFLLVVLMGVGPVVMFVALTESYGRYGLMSALIVSGFYVVLVVVAVLLRFCMRRYANSHYDDDPQVTELLNI